MAINYIEGDFIESVVAVEGDSTQYNYIYINLGKIDGYHPISLSYEGVGSSPVMIISNPFRLYDPVNNPNNTWGARIYPLNNTLLTLNGNIYILWHKNTVEYTPPETT